MKKLIVLLMGLMSVSAMASSTNFNDIIVATNVIVRGVGGGPYGSTLFMRPGVITISQPDGVTGASISFQRYSGGPSYQGQIQFTGTDAFYGNGTMLFTPNAYFLGNLTVAGTLNTVTSIAWVTNNVYVTNALYASIATNSPDGSAIASVNYVETNVFWQTNVLTGGTVNLWTNYITMDAGGGGIRILPAFSASVIEGSADSTIIPSGVRGAVIGGGEGNTIGGSGSGPTAQAKVAYATIGGGQANTVTNAAYGVIAGGLNNTIKDKYSVLSGGQQNTCGDNGVVAGGYNNEIQTWSLPGIALNAHGLGVIGGGYNNRIWTNAPTATYGGGQYAPGYGATICGGGLNLVASTAGTICGGGENTNYGPGSVIVGSDTCLIGTNCYQSFIGGGYLNSITLSSQSFIGCGLNNSIASCDKASMVGGYYNSIANANEAFMGCGYQCAISGAKSDYSSIVGGLNNTVVNSVGSVIGGGYQNTIVNANYSTIPGGTNSAALHGNTFIWNDGSSVTYSTINTNIVQFHALNGLKLDGGNFQGNGIALTNQTVGPTPVANQCIIWWSNNVLWATGPNSTKPILTGL